LLDEQYAELTVAIATLDRPAALARCLDALEAGSRLPAEIVVVDQSCDDETEHLVTRRRLARSSVRYLRQGRRGLSASRNAALAVASHRIVAMTDDDCVPGESWVAAIAEGFLAPEIDAVSGRVLPYGAETPGTYAMSSRLSTERGRFARRGPPWLAGSGGNFALRSEVWSELDGFDERLGAGSAGQAAEDMDFIYRMLAAGKTILYEPLAVIYHERQDLERRIASRWTYGYGLGAACGKWLRMGDAYALRVFGGWMLWRTLGLLAAVRARQGQAAAEHRLMLRGTLAGLRYGLRLGGRQ
jgi:glycosyltransferase involved in cell wall biosynthesis